MRQEVDIIIIPSALCSILLQEFWLVLGKVRFYYVFNFRMTNVTVR